jgi:hypothetical protein
MRTMDRMHAMSTVGSDGRSKMMNARRSPAWDRRRPSADTPARIGRFVQTHFFVQIRFLRSDSFGRRHPQNAKTDNDIGIDQDHGR